MVDFKNAKLVDEIEAPKIIIYGRNGIGKSRFSMCAPSSIFMDLDHNLGQYKVISNKSKGIEFPINTFQNVLDFITLLINEPHDFKFLNIDSTSSMNILMENQVKRENNVRALSEVPYGKGPDLIKNLWSQLQYKLEILRKTRNVGIILIGHTEFTSITDSHGTYQINKLALDKKSSEILNNWSSAILYAADILKFKEEISGFGRVNKRIIDSKKVLYTDGESISLAKNTYNLPTFIPFDDVQEAWNIFAQHLYLEYSETKNQSPQPKGDK
jgi:hypothetical protein